MNVVPISDKKKLSSLGNDVMPNSSGLDPIYQILGELKATTKAIESNQAQRIEDARLLRLEVSRLSGQVQLLRADSVSAKAESIKLTERVDKLSNWKMLAVGYMSGIGLVIWLGWQAVSPVIMLFKK